MRNFNILFKLLLLIWVNLLFSQNKIKLPDTLKKYNYIELENKILQSRNKNKNGYLYAKTYLSKAKNENQINEIIYGYIYFGNELNNFIYNLKYSDSAINLASNKQPKELCYLYYARGQIFYREKKLKDALNSFLIARKYSSTSHFDLTNAINYSIGLIKNTQGNYDEAIEIYKKCIDNSSIKFLDYPLYLLGISELYNKVNKIDLSEKYIEKGIASCKVNPDGQYYLPYFISNRGKNYFKRKQYQKSINDLISPLQTIKNNKDFSNYAENSFYIGECYRSQNKDDKAMEYYKKVDSIFIIKKDIYLHTIPAYNYLIEYYKKKENYKKVVYYSEQFIKADKVLDDNYKYITSKIAKTYDIEKIVLSKQDVILSLKKENSSSKTTITLLILGIFLFAYILYWNNRKKKEELKKQKELFEIYKSQKEKDAVKIENDNEKNNLSIKKTTVLNIDENVISYILTCLKQFELEKKYLEKEYTVEMLAAEFKTNSSYLSKVINEIKETNFTQYINTLRIEYILDKLENDNKFLHYTIQTLSEFSGYNSVQTFTRAFISYTKMKPSYFIKELKNNKL